MSNELTPANHAEYTEIISIIEHARENAYRSVNRELISMYWEIGKYINDKVKNGGWGKSVVADFARFIQRERPDLKGFSASNIWRMRQFYETYRDDEKLATLSREISWSNNVQIMARAKSREAREFYLLLTASCMATRNRSHKTDKPQIKQFVRRCDSGYHTRAFFNAETL